MKLMEWLFGGGAPRYEELEDQVAELKGQVGSLTRTNHQLVKSLELQWKLITALRDCNADLDRRLLEANR